LRDRIICRNSSIVYVNYFTILKISEIPKFSENLHGKNSVAEVSKNFEDTDLKILFEPSE